MTPRLEIACFNFLSAKIAAENEADRIEFAADYECGGVTPDPEDFKALKKITNTPIYILIRCRGGDFIYTDAEMAEMKNSIAEFKKAGADGFVLGCLNDKNEIDTEKTTELIKSAQPLPCTFHRAFDRLNNPEKGLEQIIKMGFAAILTSGGARDAISGADLLSKLISLSGDRLVIMAGGGIRSGNIGELKNKIDTSWYHSACITGKEPIANEKEIIALKQLILS